MDALLHCLLTPRVVLTFLLPTCPALVPCGTTCLPGRAYYTTTFDFQSRLCTVGAASSRKPNMGTRLVWRDCVAAGVSVPQAKGSLRQHLRPCSRPPPCPRCYISAPLQPAECTDQNMFGPVAAPQQPGSCFDVLLGCFVLCCKCRGDDSVWIWQNAKVACSEMGFAHASPYRTFQTYDRTAAPMVRAKGRGFRSLGRHSSVWRRSAPAACDSCCAAPAVTATNEICRLILTLVVAHSTLRRSLELLSPAGRHDA